MIKSYLKIAIEDIKNIEMDSTDVLLLSLIKSYDKKNKTFEMNQETIAKILNVSRRTVCSSIKNLKELCKIQSVRRYKKTSILRVTARPCNSFIKMDMDILKIGLKPNETIILTLVKNGYSVAEIKGFYPKSTVYDIINKLQELKIITENTDEKVTDIQSYRRNTTDTTKDVESTESTTNTGYTRKKSYPKKRNKFNNFKQIEYSKEEWAELENAFFN